MLRLRRRHFVQVGRLQARANEPLTGSAAALVQKFSGQKKKTGDLVSLKRQLSWHSCCYCYVSLGKQASLVG
jgi:hypothetical protein